jgi:hypothetical protein
MKNKDISHAAALLGALGGKAKSPAKARAARKNGLKGGRPYHLRGGRPKKSEVKP